MTDNGSIVLRKPEMDDLAEMGQMLIASGFFKDSTKVAQAAVKVLAGRELGLGPVESMRAFHIVEGKVEMSADLLAQRVKSHEKYDYRVIELTDDECAIRFYEIDPYGQREGDPLLGTSTFTIADAKRAGLVRPGGAWEKYPRNMLFSRALSNGVGWFCPDVAGGSRIYVEGEISGLEGQPTEDTASSVIEVEGAVEAVLRDPLAHKQLEPVVTVDGDTGEINPEPEPEMLTQAQRNHLFALASDLGYDDDERKVAAGVASFNDLTKERASELIEAWIGLASQPDEKAGAEDGEELAYGEGASGSPESAPALPEEEDDGSLPTPIQWEIALRHFDGSRPKILQAAAVLFGKPIGQSTITKHELQQVTLAKLDETRV